MLKIWITILGSIVNIIGGALFHHVLSTRIFTLIVTSAPKIMRKVATFSNISEDPLAKLLHKIGYDV